MISRELLSEVLGEDWEILKISKHFVRVRHLESYTSVEWCEHKVAHMCKEWAYNNGYSINSSVHTIQELVGGMSNYKVLGSVSMIKNWEASYEKIYGNTEPEAIFQACQWVLDNKEN